MTATYTTTDIATILQLEAPQTIRPVTTLLTDSRSLTDAEGSLFFAISTPNNDGHRYIRQLYDLGVRSFVVTHIPEEMLGVTDVTFFIVPDVTAALHTLAAHHRSESQAPIIAITGSRGKTTVKEWLYQLLSPRYKIVRSPRSFNSQIGVPLSVWEIDSDTELAIIEAGISRVGEMKQLQRIIRPDIAIITNISNEHDDGFASREQKCKEKIALMSNANCIIYCADDRMIADEIASSCSPRVALGWSETDADAPLFISRITRNAADTSITYSYLRNESTITIPFTSDIEIQNSIHSLALMLYLSLPADYIADSMKKLSPVRTRINVIEGVNNSLIIADSYTSDLHSLVPALDFMSRRRTSGRTVTVIMSDVMHETLPQQPLYKAVRRLLEQRGVDRLIGIGEEFVANSRFFGPDDLFFSSTDDFLNSMSPSDFHNELIMVKGAPGFHFNRITDMLEARRHSTVLEVDLDAIIHNFNLFRSMIRPTTGVVCMVKASGYGAGSYELAKTLQSQGAAYLAVAVLDEGVDLRQAGITMPIMVLNPRVVNYRNMFAYNLEPEIFSFEMLHEIIREGEKYGITNYPVHIKLDTGMHRLGFLESDMRELVDVLTRQNVIRPVSVFSHLAAADDPSEDEYTMSQFDTFDRCCDMLQRGFNYHIMRHILNSTGISRFPQHQHDMVRLGICLYGIHTMDDGSQDDLKPVSSLYTSIISIKEWSAGTTIGYNRKGVLSRQSVIATIPVGYADGINRHLGNGGMNVMVNGVRCPSVGNVCMDACMIDVTDCPDCKVGDRVEIFGNNVPVYELAEALDTIPYEILTSVSQRVKRVYFRD